MPQIGGTCRAFPMIEIDSNPQTPIALVLERIDFAEPDCNAQPRVDADPNFGLIGALCTRLLERVGHQALEILVCQRNDGLLFGCHVEPVSQQRKGGILVGLPTRTSGRILGARMIRRRHDDQLPDEERPSKGARKRASQELQDLGEQLIELPDAVLDALPLPDNLRDAVLNARRFPSHGAQLRQRQYIGKIMRKIDTEQIRIALEAHRQKENAATRQFQRIEQWRERLLRDPTALADLLATCPRVDGSLVQRLVASATEEAQRGSPPRSARELFHYLREILVASAP